MDLVGLACLLLTLTGVAMFDQNDFVIKYERVEVVSFNTSYIRSAKTHNFKYNRTHTAAIITGETMMAFGYKLMLEVQAYKKASNEYREFPLRFMFNYCEYAAKNDFGLGELFACGNSTGCPFKKGMYTSCAWAGNATKFPPHIPAGSYMVDLKFFYRSVEIMFLQGFGTVKYPQCKGCPV